MNQYGNIYALKARRQRVEKELKELYRIRHEMQRLAEKGSRADAKNLVMVEGGIERGLSELRDLESKLRGS